MLLAPFQDGDDEVDSLRAGAEPQPWETIDNPSKDETSHRLKWPA